MFNLTELEHTLRLQPHLLSLPLHEAVKGELEGLFVDKVIANLGQCISVCDIGSIGGFIFANEGAPTYTVKFRLIIFRPFVGEVISARLKESNADGLRLSLGFFDDIYIPEWLMPEPSLSEPDPENKGQVKWIWLSHDEIYLIDGYDEIRFRVQNVKFPEIPRKQKDLKPFAPMEIIISYIITFLMMKPHQKLDLGTRLQFYSLRVLILEDKLPKYRLKDYLNFLFHEHNLRKKKKTVL